MRTVQTLKPLLLTAIIFMTLRGVPPTLAGANEARAHCSSLAIAIERNVERYDFLGRKNRVGAAKKVGNAILGSLHETQRLNPECFDEVATRYALVSAATADQGFYCIQLDVSQLAKIQAHLIPLTPERRKDYGGSWEDLKIGGAYNCVEKTIYFDPYQHPYDVGANLVHEFEHFEMDQLSYLSGDSEEHRRYFREMLRGGISAPPLDEVLSTPAAELLFLDELNATLRSSLIQLNLMLTHRRSRPLDVYGNNVYLKWRYPISDFSFIDPNGKLRKAVMAVDGAKGYFYGATSGGYNAYLRGFQKQAFQDPNFMNVIDQVRRAYFGETELGSMNLQNERIRDFFLRRASFRENTVPGAFHAAFLDFNHHHRIIRENPQTTFIPSPACQRVTAAIASGDMDAYLGTQLPVPAKPGGNGVRPGGNGVRPGGNGVRPGGNGVRPTGSIRPCFRIQGGL